MTDLKYCTDCERWIEPSEQTEDYDGEIVCKEHRTELLDFIEKGTPGTRYE